MRGCLRKGVIALDRVKLMLHICCAPDATVPWPELLADGFDVRGFFYGGNIHPFEEYEKRADAVRSLSSILNREAVFPEYETERWFSATEAYKDEPERGKRCPVCFRLQLESAAKCAVSCGCTHLSTTLTISPHKDPVLINNIGSEISLAHGLVWVDRIWRKNNGFKRSVEESKRMGIYRQNYCGCAYSVQKG